jgi:CMP-N-acetylneuraminic acid synthetase
MTLPIIAIIPSRGGSQRIPLKSLEKVGGRSLLQRTIETARDSKLFNRIIVSTDNKQIAAEGQKYGGEVPQLRTTASDNITPVSVATIHTLEQLISTDPQYLDAIVFQLMPNCPFLTTKTLNDSFRVFHSNPMGSLLSSVQVDSINWFAFKIDEDDKPKRIIDGIATNSRTQDHPEIFVPCGTIWIATANYLLKNQTYYGEKYDYFEIPYIEAIDIDTPEQLEFARIIARGLEG